MSGIFKSVTKLFGDVGKMVKKIAPTLVMAAAVYFGGAYLGSGAGAGGFSKAAGVIKNLFMGSNTGGSSASAASFAETAYRAIQKGMPLSSSVASASSAIKAVGGGADLESAISIGLEGGDKYMTTLSETGSVADAILSADAVSDAAIAQLIPSGIDVSKDFEVGERSMADAEVDPSRMSDVKTLTDVTTSQDGLISGGQVDDFGAGGTEPGTTLPSPAPVVAAQDPTATTADTTTADTTTAAAPEINSFERWTMDFQKQQLASLALQSEQQQDYLSILRDNMAGNRKLSWAGLLASSIGSLLPTAEEKERKYQRTFKEEGTGGPKGVTNRPQYGVFGTKRGMLS